MRTWLVQSILNGLKGMAIGIANAVPGVSGGTIAVLTGIYESLIDSIANFKLSKGQWKKPLLFLLPIIIGLGIGLVGFANLVDLLFERIPNQTQFWFIGLIVGSLPFLITHATHRSTDKGFRLLAAIKVSSWFLLLIGASFLIVLAILQGSFNLGDSVPIRHLSLASFVPLFMSGIISAAAMVIPGISGSFLLVLFGMYSTFITGFRELNLVVLGTFLFGAILGILIITRLISKLLNKYHEGTYFLIIGLVLGSIASLWPGISFDLAGLGSLGALVFGLLLAYFLGKRPNSSKAIANGSDDQEPEKSILPLSEGSTAEESSATGNPKNTSSRVKKILTIVAYGLVGLGTLWFFASRIVSQSVTALEDHPARQDGFQIIAHRGGSLEYPESTMLAFTKALEAGADQLELDLHLSKDNQLVVIHDDTLQRTTNGSGQVKDHNLAQLQELDAAYWWPYVNEADLEIRDTVECDCELSWELPWRGSGVSIPSLEELFIAFPNTPLIIEMKPNDPSIIPILGSLMEKYERFDTDLVASFHQELLDLMRQQFPQASTGFSLAEVSGLFYPSIFGFGGIFQAKGQIVEVPLEANGLGIVNPDFINAAKEQNVQIHAWTINDATEMKELLNLGVDGIITDKPSLLREVYIEFTGVEDFQ